MKIVIDASSKSMLWWPSFEKEGELAKKVAAKLVK